MSANTHEHTSCNESQTHLWTCSYARSAELNSPRYVKTHAIIRWKRPRFRQQKIATFRESSLSHAWTERHIDTITSRAPLNNQKVKTTWKTLIAQKQTEVFKLTKSSSETLTEPTEHNPKLNSSFYTPPPTRRLCCPHWLVSGKGIFPIRRQIMANSWRIETLKYFKNTFVLARFFKSSHIGTTVVFHESFKTALFGDVGGLPRAGWRRLTATALTTGNLNALQPS